MSDIIKQLQENEKPFLYMGDTPGERAAMQSMAWKISYGTDFIDLEEDWGRHYNNEHSFENHLAYRLRPDYKPKPEVEECKIDIYRKYGRSLRYKRQRDVAPYDIHLAPSEPDFIGFKYEDSDKAHPLPRRYRDPETGARRDYWLPGHEVLTPTHVLFRKQH
jgi:hypothetical protein